MHITSVEKISYFKKNLGILDMSLGGGGGAGGFVQPKNPGLKDFWFNNPGFFGVFFNRFLSKILVAQFLHFQHKYFD